MSPKAARPDTAALHQRLQRPWLRSGSFWGRSSRSMLPSSRSTSRRSEPGCGATLAIISQKCRLVCLARAGWTIQDDVKRVCRYSVHRIRRDRFSCAESGVQHFDITVVLRCVDLASVPNFQTVSRQPVRICLLLLTRPHPVQTPRALCFRRANNRPGTASTGCRTSRRPSTRRRSGRDPAGRESAARKPLIRRSTSSWDSTPLRGGGSPVCRRYRWYSSLAG